jgi:hypothetical protein
MMIIAVDFFQGAVRIELYIHQIIRVLQKLFPLCTLIIEPTKHAALIMYKS